MPTTLRKSAPSAPSPCVSARQFQGAWERHRRKARFLLPWRWNPVLNPTTRQEELPQNVYVRKNNFCFCSDSLGFANRVRKKSTTATWSRSQVRVSFRFSFATLQFISREIECNGCFHIKKWRGQDYTILFNSSSLKV